MGIKGLKTFLNSRLAPHASPEEIPHSSTLLVDALGFALQIADDYQRAGNVASECGGQYRAFGERLRAEIVKLRDTFGLRLVFYFDGNEVNQLKAGTHDKRKVQREERWSNLYKLTLGDSNAKGGPTGNVELPMPPLVLETLGFLLVEMNIPVVRCQAEADQEIALACRRLNAEPSETATYCYGADTDFVAMADCPYIELGSLDQNEDGAVVVKRIFHRTEIAAELGLSEATFVELCILMGTDYTDPYSRSLYDPLPLAVASSVEDEDEEDDDILDDQEQDNDDDQDPEIATVASNSSSIERPAQQGPRRSSNKTQFPKGNRPDVIDELVAQLQEAAAYKSSSNHDNTAIFLSSRRSPKLDLAIRYSRAVYNLENLSQFSAEVAALNLDDDQDDEAMLLTENQKAHVSAWLGAWLPDGKIRNDSGRDLPLGTAVVDYLESSSTGSVAVELCVYGDAVSNVHLKALRKMIEVLNNFDRHDFPRALAQRIKWVDVFASNLFQRVVREVLRKRADLVPFSPPWKLYDGLLFHSLVAEFESQEQPAVSANDIGNQSASSEVTDPLSTTTIKDVLPIDMHRDAILEKIAKDRVTIIHGETGCGKSSRLPAILLEDAESKSEPCLMMVCQPRRIAANALKNRLRQTLGDKVGLRMGHGIRDEKSGAKIIFVTTGYIVRLLAYHPEAFDSHTHLIIDEVHERSVDGDVLCLLARRLLARNPTIRLILMSATVHTQLYKEYFTKDYDYGDMECLSVGVRRFPVDIKYLEDIQSLGGARGLPPMVTSLAKRLQAKTARLTGLPSEPLPAEVPKDQYSLAVALVRAIAPLGTGVLVFVSGISDITEIMERFEGLDNKYKLVAIHSDIPFEEQEQAFVPALPDQVKVVVATNAAESSVTLPDVDLVICLGTHKALRYNANSHRAQLVNTWISKASATQRAGRTGRVRKGNVFRLYSQELADKFLDHDQSEVHRQPLQDVILNLRVMLEDSPEFDGVEPILQDLLEPPELANIQKSFGYLHGAGMISDPSDGGVITSIGRLAGALPVDLTLGRMIAMGITLGVGAEATIMASALSQPKSIFRIASPLIHKDPTEFNSIVKQIVVGAATLDDGAYSEPIMMLKIFLAWNALPIHSRDRWATTHGLAHVRLKQFVANSAHLVDRVNKALDLKRGPGFDGIGSKRRTGISVDTLSAEQLTPSVVNSLRLILTWAGDGNVIKLKPPKLAALNQLSTIPFEVVADSGVKLTEEHLRPFLPDDLQWKLDMSGRKIFDAKFSTSRAQEDAYAHLQGLLKLATSSSSGTTSANPQSDVSVVWVHQQPQVETVEKDKTKKGKPAAQQQQPKEGYIAILVLQHDPAQAKDSMEKLLPLFTQRSLRIANVIEGHPMFLLNAPSAKEIKLMKTMHEVFPGSLSLLIPSLGNPKVTASNCQPSRGEMERFFFGTSSAEVGDEWSDDRYIGEQVVALKQEITFPSPFEAPKILEDNKKSTKKATTKSKSQETAPPRQSSLIDDVNIGVRLLASYMSGFKKSPQDQPTMKMWKTPPRAVAKSQSGDLEEVAAKAADGPRLVPGSKEWLEAKKASESTSGPGADNADDEANMIRVRFRIPKGFWSLMPALSIQNSVVHGNIAALLPRQSIQAVATHCGRGTLFGVAHSTMLMGAPPTQTVRCEGVTFLPPGTRWLSLALRCAGINPASVASYASAAGFAPMNGRLDRMLDKPLSKAYLKVCFEVDEQIQSTQLGPIDRNDRLIELLDLLFAPWTNDEFEEVDRIIEDEFDDFDDFQQGAMFARAASLSTLGASSRNTSSSSLASSSSTARLSPLAAGVRTGVGARGSRTSTDREDEDVLRAFESLAITGDFDGDNDTEAIEQLRAFAGINLNLTPATSANVAGYHCIDRNCRKFFDKYDKALAHMQATGHGADQLYKSPGQMKSKSQILKLLKVASSTPSSAGTSIPPASKDAKQTKPLQKAKEPKNDKAPPKEKEPKQGKAKENTTKAVASAPIPAGLSSAVVTLEIVRAAVDALTAANPYYGFSKKEIKKEICVQTGLADSAIPPAELKTATKQAISSGIIKKGVNIFMKTEFVIDKAVVANAAMRLVTAPNPKPFTTTDILEEVCKEYRLLTIHVIGHQCDRVKSILNGAVKDGLLKTAAQGKNWFEKAS